MTSLLSSGHEFCALARELLGRGVDVRYRAEGWSMCPAIRSGDILTIMPGNAEEAQVGEVVLCESLRGTLVAHRLVSKLREQGQLILITRGDALSYSDPHLPEQAYLGRVSRIERHERVIDLTGHRAELIGKMLVRFPFVANRWLPLLSRARARLLCILGVPRQDVARS